jgi:hypothetical protein
MKAPTMSLTIADDMFSGPALPAAAARR